MTLGEGTVVRIHGLHSVVDDGAAEHLCVFRGLFKKGRQQRTNPVAVGDCVRFQPGLDGAEGVIDEILPRRTVLAKHAARNRRKEQIVAVNVDQILIVVSLVEPPLKLYQIDRFLVAAQAGDLQAALVLNKTDLVDNAEEAVASVRAVYAAIDLPIFPAAAREGAGLEAVGAWLQNRVTFVGGPSGSGKSTLINRFLADVELPTGEVNTKTRYGSHTTTTVSMEKLLQGGFIVDTPGVREFEGFQIDTQTLGYHYPDMVPFARRCRFNTCTHLDEPGCAVRDAVDEGRLHPNRYQTYCYLLRQIADMDRKLRP